MLVEVVAAALVGLAALWLVLQPLLTGGRRTPPAVDPLDSEETPKGLALAALKEIEFDRETGKLSEGDYEFLKAKYTASAVEALREDDRVADDHASDDVEAMIAARVRTLRSAAASTPPDAPGCPVCGPRPEQDAVFCSSCGRRLPAASACGRCGAALPPGSRFCEACGTQVAA